MTYLPASLRLAALLVTLSVATALTGCAPGLHTGDDAGDRDGDDAGPLEEDAGPPAEDAGPPDAGPPTSEATGFQRGTALADEVLALAAMPDGRVAVAGYEGGTLGGRVDPGGDARPLLAWYTADGELYEDRALHSSGATVISALHVDDAGELWAAGRTTGALPGETNGGQNDAFVARAPEAAVFDLWRQLGDERPQRATAFDVDAAGRIALVGYEDVFVPTNFVEAWEDGFVARLSRQEDELHLDAFQREGTPAPDLLLGVAWSRTEPGAIVVAGLRLEGPGRGIFVEKRGADGALRWNHAISSLPYDTVAGLAIDGDGRVIIAGSSWLTLGPADAGAGAQDVFVLWLDEATGEVLSVAQDGTPGVDWANGMALAHDGTVWVVGETTGEASPNAGDFDAFAIAFDGDGHVTRRWQRGTPEEDVARAVAVTADGRVFIGGYTLGAIVDGGASKGGRDGFVFELP